MRGMNPNKASPSWAVPTAAWVLAEKHSIPALQESINNSLKTGKNVKTWARHQTVWIPKLGKDQGNMENLRPITLADPGYKAYLKILYTQIQNIQEGQWKHHQDGAISHRGTTDAILIVNEPISRMHNNKKDKL